MLTFLSNLSWSSKYILKELNNFYFDLQRIQIVMFYIFIHKFFLSLFYCFNLVILQVCTIISVGS